MSLFNFIPEWRDGIWFAVDFEQGVELACFFELESTAEEIGRRTSDSEAQYITSIPVVPHGTPVPRPADLADHPATVARRIREGKSPFLREPEHAGRHSLNPDA